MSTNTQSNLADPSGLAKLCSMPNCAEPPRANQRYCPECHSKYMKAWRAKRKRQQTALLASVLKMRATIINQNQQLKELADG